jgi:hypothetical protein
MERESVYDRKEEARALLKQLASNALALERENWGYKSLCYSSALNLFGDASRSD